MRKVVISAAVALLFVSGWASSAEADPPDEVRVSVQQVYCAAEGAWCNPYEAAAAKELVQREPASTRDRARVLSELSLEPPAVPGLVEVRLAADQVFCLAEEQWCYVTDEAGAPL